MALKDTVSSIHTLLSALKRDLEKSERGNKAASQRVRTGSIKLEKLAKKYRKESVAAEKGKKKKKPVKKKVAKKKVCKKKPCKAKRKKRR